MINFFKKKTSEQKEVAAVTAILKTKTTTEIIEEIHHSFYSEVDAILAEAGIQKSTDGMIKECDEKKAERLKKLGFEQTQEVESIGKKIKERSLVEEENRKKQATIDAVHYFSQKYPLYKFITEESVKRICKKYNLIYGTSKRYIGTVPDKNLEQMEAFKVSIEDKAYEQNICSFNSWGNNKQTSIMSYASYISERDASENRNVHAMLASRGTAISYNEAPFEICAPAKDFNTKGMDLKDFKLTNIEIPDPIVLQPIVYQNVKHYLIVTRWGDEASDENVVNQKLN